MRWSSLAFKYGQGNRAEGSTSDAQLFVSLVARYLEAFKPLVIGYAAELPIWIMTRISGVKKTGSE